MIRMKTNKTTAQAIRASRCRPVAYPISKAILEERVRIGSSRLSGMAGELPQMNTTAAVSPNALPRPKMMEVTVPDFAAGKMVRKMARYLVAPRAMVPS